MNQPEKFEQWCLIEIFGHNRIAGLVTEASLGGGSFIRVDVPEVALPSGARIPTFTKFLGPSSIFSITAVSEETARKLAAGMQVQPISTWDIRQVVDEAMARRALPVTAASDGPDPSDPEFIDHDDDEPL
jgi:hypothetical protein